MKKKRKGSECDAVLQEVLQSICNSLSSLSSRKSHFSFEDANLRSTKRCKEEECVEDVGSFKSRLAGIATAPPCGSSSLVAPGRGIKRKIGCIDVSTQIRKNKLEDDYILDSTIGQGKFGSVWLCRSRSSGEEFACKTLLKGEETVHREVEIMQHLSGHQGVVTLEAVYEEAECFHLVMELCSGGRLIDQMSKDGDQLSEHRAANIFKEVMLVIKYCHDMGVVHRDIKPENILLTASGKIKLADFGLAMRVASGQGLNGLAGSAAYVSPEVLLGNYSEKVDIWSAGVLLHALLVGVLPFKGDSLDAVFEAIKTVKLDFHIGIWESVSKPARNLIEKMLTRDASARITAEEVLRHPWILFYTDRTLKILSIKSRSKHVVAHQMESEKKKTENSPLHERSFESSSSDNEEQDECALIDALTGAVSQVRISEPKRTRLCVPSTSPDSEEQGECALVDALTGAVSQVRISEPKRTRLRVPSTSPIPQQCSSNMSSNNLCKAF